jgi:hypothetical protein
MLRKYSGSRRWAVRVLEQGRTEEVQPGRVEGEATPNAVGFGTEPRWSYRMFSNPDDTDIYRDPYRISEDDADTDIPE